jgi:hypothetical protein
MPSPPRRPIPECQPIYYEPFDSGIYLSRRAATPDEVARLLDLERRRESGELSTEDYETARAELLTPAPASGLAGT